jgi:hypothetical protein
VVVVEAFWRPAVIPAAAATALMVPRSGTRAVSVTRSVPATRHGPRSWPNAGGGRGQPDGAVGAVLRAGQQLLGDRVQRPAGVD